MLGFMRGILRFLARFFLRLLPKATSKDSDVPRSTDRRLHIWCLDEEIAVIARDAHDASQLYRDDNGCEECGIMCPEYPTKCNGADPKNWTMWPDGKPFTRIEILSKGSIDITATRGEAVSMHQSVTNGVRTTTITASPSWWVRERRGVLDSL